MQELLQKYCLLYIQMLSCYSNACVTKHYTNKSSICFSRKLLLLLENILWVILHSMYIYVCNHGYQPTLTYNIHIYVGTYICLHAFKKLC